MNISDKWLKAMDNVYMNDLPLLLRETEVDIYADDTTIWLSGANCNADTTNFKCESK